MKKIFKKIFVCILSGIIFGSIGVWAGTIINSNEIIFTPKNSKWQVDNVESALNDLHDNIKNKYEEYTGTTTITPTYNDITLNTQDKILKDNITINGIPSTYKNLTNTTTVVAENVLKGKTVYNSNGNLITGVLDGQCSTGKFIISSNCAGSTGCVLSSEFVPTKFYFYYTNYSNSIFFYDADYDSTYYYQYLYSSSKATLNKTLLSKAFKIENNKLIGYNWGNSAVSRELIYIICK